MITRGRIGGALGLADGEAGSPPMNRYPPLSAHAPLRGVPVGLAVPAAVGLVFGLRPAWQAARLGPVEALRYG